MKVDLTQRDIELLLFLINEAAAGGLGSRKRSKFTMQEISLITKLEKALGNDDLIEKIMFSAGKESTLH
jgi:hypothetical protein